MTEVVEPEEEEEEEEEEEGEEGYLARGVYGYTGRRGWGEKSLVSLPVYRLSQSRQDNIKTNREKMCGSEFLGIRELLCPVAPMSGRLDK